MKNTISKLKGSNILITGGCGFIGHYLVKRLINLGVKKITIIDSMEFGNKSKIKESEQVKIIKYTIDNIDDDVLLKVLKGIDYLFHLAAFKHNQTIDRPKDVLNRNVDGTFRLYEAAMKNKVKKVLFSSSVDVYNRNNFYPLKESERPSPWTVYGTSKVAGENLLSHFFHWHDLNYIVLRYFFVYGPRQFAGTGYRTVIVENFERILRNENPIIFGDGEQILDYIYIDDIIDATVKAMESNHTNEIFNIGSSVPTTINHLTDVMLKVSGKKLKKVYGPADITHGTSRLADTSKIKDLLGFQPSISLEQGLQKTYDWLKNQANL